jgi:hypothetical protein
MSAFGIAIAAAARAALRRMHLSHAPNNKGRRLAEEAARRREAAERSQTFGKRR